MKYIKNLQFLLVYNFLLVTLKIEYSKWKIKNRKNQVRRIYGTRVI